MGQPRKHPLPEIGDIIDDVKIIDVYRKNGFVRCRIKCKKCGRERDVPHLSVYKHQSTRHVVCGRKLLSEKTKFHKTWLSIRWRTTNPNAASYRNYGGRGISSEAFKYFVDFYDTMYESYLAAVEEYGDESIISIDRIDPNGDYCPENCRWISMAEQAGNTRRNRKFKIEKPNGEIEYAKNQSAYARENGIPLTWIKHSLRDGVTRNGWKFTYIDPPYNKNSVA